MIKIRRLDALEWLLLGLLFIILVCTVRIDKHVAYHVLDDDASSEIMLAELLNREKRLYSDDFYYSTEFFVQNQIIFGILFNIFDGWANVRFFGSLLIQLLYLAAFVYMMSQSGLDRKAVLFSACLVMLPYNVAYGRTVLYHCYYVPNFAPGYILIGLLFSFIHKDKNNSRISKFTRIVLIALVSFLSCFLYVRQIFLTMIPVAGCLFFWLLSHSDPKETPYKSWMLLPVLMIVAGLAGMICNSILLIPSLNLYQQTAQNLNVLSPASWGPILEALLIQFGFRKQVKMFSVAGILGLGGLFNTVILIYCSVSDLRQGEITDFREYLMRTMLPVTLFMNLVIFVCGEIPFRLQVDYSRYLIPSTVWIIPMLSCHLKTKYHLPHIRRIIFIICTVIFASNGIFNSFSFLNSQRFGQLYDGISYDNPHLADDMQSVIEYIRIHDYHYGYAFAGEANVLVELLNGMPVVSLRRNGSDFEYTNWLTLKSYKTVQSERAFFLMTSQDEPLYQEMLNQGGTERVYFDDQGYVLYDISDVSRFRELIHEP